MNLIYFKETQTESSLSWAHVLATASWAAIDLMWHWLLPISCTWTCFSTVCSL